MSVISLIPQSPLPQGERGSRPTTRGRRSPLPPVGEGPGVRGNPRILVTRPADKATAFCALLEAAGLEPVCLPATETQPVEETSALDAALARLADYRWIVFTSGTAAHLFCRRTQALGVSTDAVGALAVVGPATAEVLAGYGVCPMTVISPFSAERALVVLATLVRPGDRALLPRPERGLETLAHGLRASGARVDEVVLYRTTPADAGGEHILRQLAGGEIDAVTFFSPSAVHGLDAAVAAAGLPALEVARCKDGTPVACIGPTTASAAQEAGWRAVVISPETAAESLVATLVAALPAHVRQEAMAC
jgi:uroporphyrinogen-III synthase